jgi:DNA-directed RNA polymerase subunit H (RpoH/RPB5)
MSDLSNVEMKYTEVVNTVLENLSQLLIRRGIATKPLDNDFIKEIQANKTDTIKIGDNKISVYILNQELKNISSNSPTDEWLSKNIDHHKFLIVKNFTKKTYKQIYTEYKNAEIFSIYELLEDIPSKQFIPTHTLVVGDDREELLKTFSLKEFGRINSTDMMARYYGAKINDIFRIERPNINSGISIYYRVVINGSLEIFS